MKEKDIPGCGREDDLVGFLYGDLSEIEQRSFKTHLQTCSVCSDQLMQFGSVRESISEWRQESLGSTAANTPLVSHAAPRNRSALSAWRAFFDLSPLWMKGAVAFAAVLFLVVGTRAFIQWRERSATLPPASSQAKYSQAELDRIVEQRVKEQVAMRANSPAVVATAFVPRVKPDDRRVPTNRNSRTRVEVAHYSQIQKAQRPLSRTERAELAADLRLVTSSDRSLNLVEDQINQ